MYDPWPKLIFAINKVCQFLLSFMTMVQSNALKCIMWYLKGTNKYGTLVTPACFLDKWSIDANLKSCSGGCHSNSGYYTFLGDNLISWSPSKQKIVSLPKPKSELVDWQMRESVLGGISSLEVVVQTKITMHSTLRQYWCSLYWQWNHAPTTKHIKINQHLIVCAFLKTNLVVYPFQ